MWGRCVCDVAIPFAFPLWYLAPALAGTILLVTLLYRSVVQSASARRRAPLRVEMPSRHALTASMTGACHDSDASMRPLIRVPPNRRPVGDPVVAVKGAPLDQRGAR